MITRQVFRLQAPDTGVGFANLKEMESMTVEGTCRVSAVTA
ncbi:MAG TPA: hypothetical protein VEI49_12455 [Terriglobales bacterium]|nr:hypothetical protein [Terriglobales bacterium]